MRFNLLDEPWIPVIWRKRPQEVSNETSSRHTPPRKRKHLDAHRGEIGILDALEHAADIREIFDDTPIVTVAIYRMLLTFVVAARADPTSGNFFQKCEDYAGKWYDRFWLIGGKHPFLQIPNKETGPGAGLIPHATVGTNRVHFSHTFDQQPDRVGLSFAEAARWLLATHTNQGMGPPYYAKGILGTAGTNGVLLGARLLDAFKAGHERFKRNDGEDPVWEHVALTTPRPGKVSDLAGLLWPTMEVSLQQDSLARVKATKGERIATDDQRREWHDAFLFAWLDKDKRKSCLATDSSKPTPFTGLVANLSKLDRVPRTLEAARDGSKLLLAAMGVHGAQATPPYQYDQRFLKLSLSGSGANELLERMSVLGRTGMPSGELNKKKPKGWRSRLPWSICRFLASARLAQRQSEVEDLYFELLSNGFPSVAETETPPAEVDAEHWKDRVNELREKSWVGARRVKGIGVRLRDRVSGKPRDDADKQLRDSDNKAIRTAVRALDDMRERHPAELRRLRLLALGTPTELSLSVNTLNDIVRNVAGTRRRDFWLVATLFALHHQPGGKGCLGTLMARLRDAALAKVRAKPKEIQRRTRQRFDAIFERLLITPRDALLPVLREITKLALLTREDSAGERRPVPIDWETLLEDLRGFTNRHGGCRARWEAAYYRKPSTN